MEQDFRVIILQEKERKTKMVRMESAVKVFALIACVLLLVGCQNKAKEKALTERADAAEAALSEAKTALTKSQGQAASLKEELEAAKDARDELAQQVKQLTGERDNAIAKTQGGQDVIKKLTDQLNEQTNKANVLQTQVNELQKVTQTQRQSIEQQQATIEQLQKTIEELKRAPPPSATEPNTVAIDPCLRRGKLVPA